MAAVVPSYTGFGYPVEIISHGVWRYHRFPPSLREVEEMMMERGMAVTYETIRGWWPQVWADLCERTAPPTATPRR